MRKVYLNKVLIRLENQLLSATGRLCQVRMEDYAREGRVRIQI